MPSRNSWIGIGLLLLAAGCSPGTKTVFVDVPAVVRASAEPSPAEIRIPAPPRAETGVFVAIPGKAEMPVRDRPKTSGADLRASIERAQALALRRIENSLRRFYDAELQRFELEQQRQMTEKERAAYEAASQRLRGIFEIYADHRMPVFTSLTLLSGFPDPNPQSELPEVELTPLLQNRFERTVKLRTQLREIDASFDADVLALMRDVQDLTAEQRAAMLLRIEDFKRELDRRAEEEAKAQVRRTASELGLHLIEPISITLPATEAQDVRVPAQPALPAAPNVPSKGILTSATDRERLVRHELDIWAKLNRYTVSDSPTGNPDETQAFKEWRRQFAVGP